MKTYIVHVGITFSRSYEVQAESREQARNIAESIAENCPQDQIRWGAFVGASAYDIEEDTDN